MFGSRRCFNGGAFPRLRTRGGGVPKTRGGGVPRRLGLPRSGRQCFLWRRLRAVEVVEASLQYLGVAATPWQIAFVCPVSKAATRASVGSCSGVMARTKARPQHQEPTQASRSRSPRRPRPVPEAEAEGAEVAAVQLPRVGSRSRWFYPRTLPPWFRRWRHPMRSRPLGHRAYENQLMEEPERPHWFWTPTPSPATPIASDGEGGPRTRGDGEGSAGLARHGSALDVLFAQPEFGGLAAALIAQGGPLLPPPALRQAARGTGCQAARLTTRPVGRVVKQPG